VSFFDLGVLDKLFLLSYSFEVDQLFFQVIESKTFYFKKLS
jgi:hypothetical protein